MDVILRVPDRDPPHSVVVISSSQACPLHDLLRDPRPPVIGENRIVRSGTRHAMPDRFVKALPGHHRKRLIEQ
jgi:hypothetical protein